MFEEYLQDSHEFFMLARQASRKSEERTARRYFRASVFYAAGAIEAFTNYIADSLAKAQTLSNHEISFLNDKALVFDAKKGKLVEKTEFHKLDDKLRFLLNIFVPDFDYSSVAWSHLMEFKKFRDAASSSTP